MQLKDDNGKVIGNLFKTLSKGECSCNYNKYPDRYIVQGDKVYRKVKR